MCRVLRDHLVSLASLLYSNDLAMAAVAMEIVNSVGLPERRDITMITKLCAATVTLLLHSLQLSGKSLRRHLFHFFYVVIFYCFIIFLLFIC